MLTTVDYHAYSGVGETFPLQATFSSTTEMAWSLTNAWTRCVILMICYGMGLTILLPPPARIALSGYRPAEKLQRPSPFPASRTLGTLIACVSLTTRFTPRPLDVSTKLGNGRDSTVVLRASHLSSLRAGL